MLKIYLLIILALIPVSFFAQTSEDAKSTIEYDEGELNIPLPYNLKFFSTFDQIQLIFKNNKIITNNQIMGLNCYDVIQSNAMNY